MHESANKEVLDAASGMEEDGIRYQSRERRCRKKNMKQKRKNKTAGTIKKKTATEEHDMQR